MKKLAFYISLFFFTAYLLASCKTEEDNYTVDFGYDYMPLEVGKFIEYEVDSIIYDPNGEEMVFNSKTYVRDIIVDTLKDNIGETLYKTERYTRTDINSSWQIKKVYTQGIQGNQGIVTEDNLRIIKLAFPLTERNTWDALVHVDSSIQISVAGETMFPFISSASKVWSSRVLAVDEPEQISTFNFDEVCTIREANNGSFSPAGIFDSAVENRTDDSQQLELRMAYEKYAKGVGLVYRERWILESQECQTRCTPQEQAYGNCITDCLFACQQNGSDSLDCQVQCDLACLEAYVALQNCFTECDTLSWEQKANKGFIMRQKVIDFN